MKHLIKSAVLSIIAITMAFSAKAAQPNDVYFFVVPEGYDLELLSKTLGVENNFLIKYNPQANDGVFAGMRMYIPAASISEESLKKIDASPTFAGDALKSVYEYAHSGGMNQTRPQPKSTRNNEEMTMPSKTPSTNSTIKVDGFYIDPTWRDVSYRSMDMKIKGEVIVAYKDPLTGRFVECNIPYHKMTPQEKSQMKLFDSQGRSYELYVGDSQYIAQVGKLTVYFTIPKRN